MKNMCRKMNRDSKGQYGPSVFVALNADKTFISLNRRDLRSVLSI
jgi:hypothetical protein